MKTFFDGVFISKEHLKEAGIEYPIKIEYFKTSVKENVESKFGIEVVKKEFMPNYINIEKKEVRNVTNDEAEENKILCLLRDNEVTPIGVEDVLKELL